MLVTTLRDKIAGTIYGTALGDALGRDTEFMRLPQIWKVFGTRGRMPLSDPALLTDDTQMTLAVARALGNAHSLTPNALSRTLTYEFIDWMRHDARRAPGVTCLTAIDRLQRGVPWQRATMRESKGCGANMRVAPVAFVPDVRDLPGIAQLQAAMTHGHPTALAASDLTAWAVRLAAAGHALTDLPHLLWQRAQDQRDVVHRDWVGISLGSRVSKGWDECAAALDQLCNLLAMQHTPTDICKHLGEAWIAEEALVVALYCAARFEDPVEAISAGARTSGDSDSIACITGALVGAAHGVKVWPEDWCARIERRTDIEAAVDTLDALYQSQPVPAVASQRTRKNVDRGVTTPIIPPVTTLRVDLVSELAKDGLTIDGEVVRRKNGTIDHWWCEHGPGRNARRRCARRNLLGVVAQ